MTMYPEIVQPGYPNRWVEGLKTSLYHGDLTAQNATSLPPILKSPHTYLTQRMTPKEPTEDMIFGTHVHLAILEPEKFESQVIIQPTFSGKGMKAAKEEWESSLDPRQVILTQEQYDDIQGMKESISQHDEADFLVKRSLKEQTGYFRDPHTGILCRFRCDFLHPGLMRLGDLKTTKDCTAYSFSKTIWERRYDMQMYFYKLGTELITGKKVEPVFLAVEKKPPYEVALYTIDDELIFKAKTDYEKAMSTLKECILSEKWPRYQSQNQTINLPKYAFYE